MIWKKYNARTFRRIRQLYLFFENLKWSPLGTNLSVSHIIELKVARLKKEHIGQIEIYMNYIDRNLKKKINKKQLA